MQSANGQSAGQRTDGKGKGGSGSGAFLCKLGLLGALTGLALPVLTPWWLGFDVFSQFTIHFIILAVACALGLFTRQGIRLALPVAIAGVLALSFWAYTHRVDGFANRTDDGRIRVMSFNTWARNKDLKAIAAEVRRQKPDIVGMMEFVPPKQKLLNELKDELPNVGHCMDLPHCYLAFFSRWPIEKISGKSLWEGPPYLHAVVRTPQGRVHVFVVHTLRFPWLGSQMKQVRALARLIKRVKGPKIVMGDFNSTPFSSMLLTFERGTRLPLRTYVPSWPAWAGPLPQLAIDHILASPVFRTVSGPYIGDNAGSDHYPVILELKMKEAGAKDAALR